MGEVLKIEKVIVGGKGLARRDDGMIVMVDAVLPGEQVEIGESRIRSGYAEAEVAVFLSEHEQRVEPPCPHYGECGGCDLQHGAYELQLVIKRDMVLEALTRAGVEFEPGVVGPTLPSPEPFGYRQRIRCQVDRAGGVGFFRRQSKTVVPVARCLTVTEPLNQLLGKLGTTRMRAFLARWCTELELFHSPGDDSLAVTAAVKKGWRGARASAKKAAELLGIENFFLRRGHRVEPLFPHCRDYSLFRTFGLPDGAGRFIFGWGVDCFSQINDAQNERLMHLVAELMGDPRGMRVLDLYCGAGNFSLPLAVQGARGLGIEQNSSAIGWARRNSTGNGIKGWEFIVADVEKALADLSLRGELFDTVLLDPPRRGMGRASELLPGLANRNIIYISCDPATMARDLKILQSKGMRLVSLTPADMFPQTHHIESVALLKKN